MAGIEVIIGANTDGLDEAVSRSRRSVNRLSDDFKKGIATAAKYSAAAIAAGAAIGVLAVSSIKAAKETVDLARVANSSVATFQKMSFAAKSVGVESEQLADILKDMSDRVGDFITTGGGPMADFFEKIAPQVGVTAEQFRKLSGPDALQLYVSSLEKANLSQNEMTFFMEAIASDSTRLLPLLKDNGAAMAEQAEQAEALGLALSDIDAQNITDAAAQIDRIGSVFGAFSDQAAAEIAPLISSLGRQFLDFAEDAGGVDKAVSDLAETVDTAADAAAGLAIIVVGRLTPALAASGGALAFNAVQAVRVQIALARMAGASTAAAVGMGTLGAAARVASTAMAFLGGPVGVALIAAGSLYYFRDALFATKIELGETGEEVRQFTEGLEDMTAATVKSNRQSLADRMRENKIATAEASAELDRLREKEKSQDIVNQGRPGAATAQTGDAEDKVARLTKLGKLIEKEQEKLEGRSESLAEQSAATTAAAAAAAAQQGEILKKKLAERIEVIREAGLSEREVVAERYAQDRADLKKAKEMNLEIEGGYSSQLKDLKQREKEDLAEISGEEGEAQEKLKEELNAKLETIREAGLSEVDLLKEKQALELEAIIAGKELELEVKGGYDELERETKNRHQEELTAIEERAAAERTKIKEQEARNKAAAERQFWSDATSLMNSGSRKMFEIGKAASIAQAVVKGQSAAVSAWEAGMSTGGPHAPVVAAAYTAASLAKTAGQISAIRSASFGGGGGGSGGGGGGGSVTQGINNQSEPVQPPTETMVANLNIQGQNFDRRTVIGLVEQINDLQEDGMRIRLNTV